MTIGLLIDTLYKMGDSQSREMLYSLYIKAQEQLEDLKNNIDNELFLKKENYEKENKG